MASPTPLLPAKLSLFLSAPDRGAPVARTPVYAEILVRTDRADLPVVDVDQRLQDFILLALRDDDPVNVSEQFRASLAEILAQAVARALGPTAADVLRNAGIDPVEFISAVVRRARGAMGGAALAPPSPVLQKAMDKAARAEAEDRQLPLLPQPEAKPTLWAYPLGVLATDHVGYLSFDLARLPLEVRVSVREAMDARRRDPAAQFDVGVTVYLLGEDVFAFDALEQGRFTVDGIITRLELDPALVPKEAMGLALPSMQDPSLADWRLSPGSFAASPTGLLGKDGCESLLPADLSLQEFFFYQVVRLSDVPTPDAPAIPGQIALGLVNDYHIAWRSLGHSLGQILYSLPLAPGESVNLAVVDWTRRDEAQRKERTSVDEQLVHNEHRDRVISETVGAAVSEYQHGSSFMGGIAGAAGGSVGVLSAGVAGSLGGSTSSSSGQRDLKAGTVQNISDNISQVSSASRELQSTVVVQSVQSEHEAIETRTVANYNHSHALTILYYEVLRHFRVVTEYVRNRPAILVRMRQDWFTAGDVNKSVRDNRGILAAALLDTHVAAGFDALERIEQRLRRAAALPPPVAPPAGALAIGDREFIYFTFEMRTGGMYAMDMDDHGKRTEITAAVVGGVFIKLIDPVGGDVLNQRGSFRQAEATNTFTARLPDGQPPVRWSSIAGIGFWINPQGGDEEKISFASIKVTAIDTAGAGEVLIDQSYAAGHLIVTDEGANMLLPTRRPPPPPPPPPVPSAEELQDSIDSTRLIDHLKDHAAYYSRVINLGRNPVEQAAELQAIKLVGGASVADKLVNRPIEIVGDYLAFPCTDPDWEDAIRDAVPVSRFDDEPLDERLVALPTRGVFAEAKLGHCNASEIIDNTRFWDWQQSPIPRMAPEIAPITAATPQPQAQPLAPTGLPAPVVNIVNPPSAPDPTGMSAAMNLLSTPNLFRDMSGRAEVAAVLQNLADNAVKIAGGGGGAGGSSASRATGASATGGGIGGPRATPTQPSAVNRDLQDFGKVLGQARESGLITPEATEAAFTRAAQESAGGPMVAFKLADADVEGGDVAVAPLLSPDPVHADEAGKTLLTYQHDKFAIFVPEAVLLAFQDEMTDVKVHLFFTAGRVALRDLLVHGVRGSSNDSDWVTITIPGKLDSFETISDAEIIDCLRAANIQGKPTALRLTGHSRGCDSVMATLLGKNIKDLSLIDRVTFLDEAVEHFGSGPKKGGVRVNRANDLTVIGIPAAKMVAYEVNNRSVNTVTGASARVPGATYIELPPNCMGAVGLARLIQDSVALKPTVATALDALPDLKTLVNALVLPPRGEFTTKGAAGKTSITDFCQSNKAQVQNIVAGLANPKKSVLNFSVFHDLTGYHKAFDWGIARHHFFVAEIAHELVD